MNLETRAVEEIARRGGLIVDAGGGTPFTKGLAQYRDLFAGTDYKTLDYDDSTSPDIVGDIHALPFEDATVDAFICRSVLEHVRDPRQAVSEMHRSLVPGGAVLISVPSIYPYHARIGHYPDYWRFFEDGLRSLLEEFGSVEIEALGGPATAVVMFTPALNRYIGRLRDLTYRIDDRIAARRGRRNPSILVALARK
jgi:SAM-dependent methyltransferase